MNEPDHGRIFVSKTWYIICLMNKAEVIDSEQKLGGIKDAIAWVEKYYPEIQFTIYESVLVHVHYGDQP